MIGLPPGWALAVSAILASLGVFCITAHRSAVRILLGVELILNAAIINFVAFAAARGDAGGAVFAVAIMAAAAAEAAVGLALVFALFAVKRRSDVELSDELSR